MPQTLSFSLYCRCVVIVVTFIVVNIDAIVVINGALCFATAATPVGTKNIISVALFSGYGDTLVKEVMEMFNGKIFMVTLREKIMIQM